jgi:hypothetical protein
VTFRAQSGNELSRQVLIQQDFHVGWKSTCFASSSNAPRTASPVRLG